MSDDPFAPFLVRVAGQDRAAFRSLYGAASAKLFGVTLRILGNRAEAEDALQEVFTRVWLNARRFDPARGRAMPWMVAIARNHAIDRLRARATAVQAAPDETAAARVADTAPRAETRVIAQGEARRIGTCLDRLDPDRAAAVRGAYLDGLSYEDLALRHDVPLNTMRTWLRRSLMKLKECLEA